MRGRDLAMGWLAAWLAATGCSSGGAARADGGAAGADGVATGTDAAADVEGAVFRAVAPCTSEADYVLPTNWDGWVHIVTTPAPAYSPKCIKAARYLTLYMEGSPDHPIVGTHVAGSSEGNPISADPAGASNNIRPTFSVPGFYSFECVNHGAQGMAGVVWLTPP